MAYEYIAIEREYASGGNEIGQKAADVLELPFYGHEILEIVAKREGVSPARLERMEERATNSFIYSIYAMSQIINGSTDESGLPSPERLHLKEVEVIKELAQSGPCVFIGHSAGAVLKERPDVLRVFIYADRKFRTARAQSVYGVDSTRVVSTLEKSDNRRANFYRMNMMENWDERKNYHLMLNSARLGVDTCVKLIVSAYGR